LTQVDAFQNNAGQLQKEAFKVDTVLAMMNNCSD